MNNKGKASMIIYGDVGSGNCYKIKLLLSLLNIKHRWVHIDILKKDTQTADFLLLNPNGKIPVLVLDDGRVLSESNAIFRLSGGGIRVYCYKFLYESKNVSVDVL